MKIRQWYLLFVLAAFLLMGEAGVAFAAEAKNVPTNIKSSRMQYDAANQRVIFEGAVHVTRPDFELWSDKLFVYLEKTGKKNTAKSGNGTESSPMGMDAGKVERLVAEKNVRMKQENRTGTCGRAVYTVADGKVVMEQTPVIIDGTNKITGKIINFYTRDSRSEVVGGVEANFTTSDKEGFSPKK